MSPDCLNTMKVERTDSKPVRRNQIRVKAGLVLTASTRLRLGNMVQLLCSSHMDREPSRLDILGAGIRTV